VIGVGADKREGASEREEGVGSQGEEESVIEWNL